MEGRVRLGMGGIGQKAKGRWKQDLGMLRRMSLDVCLCARACVRSLMACCASKDACAS